MSELVLTLLRFGFLALLWVFVLGTVAVLRRDLAASADTGLALPGSRPAKRPGRPSRTRPRSLVVVHGSLQGTVLPLGTTPITIGRAPDCALVLDDDYASGQHARLYQADGRWVVEDLGSTNGTWISRTRITGPTVLELGAPLRIGRTVIELRK